MKHFKTHELVSKKIYESMTEEEIFALFDPNLLIFIDMLRDDLGKAITINNWFTGGQFSQRGYRDDNKVGATRSPHKINKSLGMKVCRALDFDVKGMTPKAVRDYINSNREKYSMIRRMESDVNWVHVDTVPVIYFFKA
jgi:hypothetical protein